MQKKEASVRWTEVVTIATECVRERDPRRDYDTGDRIGPAFAIQTEAGRRGRRT
jgi:hypothetical protein